MKAKFTAVVTSHDNMAGLRKILGNLLYQTHRPEEVLAFVSNITYGGLSRVREDFEHKFEVFKVKAEEDMGDWGHEKRAQGIIFASCDYLGFFNDDDDYDLAYIEKMLDAAKRTHADVVYCDWSGVADCEFRLCSSTSGNFIVRREAAVLAGYEERCYDADGRFIERLRAMPTMIVKLPEKLYTHNGGVQRGRRA